MGNFLTKTMTNVVVGQTKKAATTAAKTAVVGATTNMIAKALGLDDSLVGRVLMVGVPMMFFAGAEDPSISEKLFGNSKKKDKKKKDKKEAENDFFDVFGDTGHKMNKAIAKETGATEDEVSGIMGLFLPTFEDAIAEEEPEDAGALQKHVQGRGRGPQEEKPQPDQDGDEGHLLIGCDAGPVTVVYRPGVSSSAISSLTDMC